MTLKNEIKKLCKKFKLNIDFTKDTWETEFTSNVHWHYISIYQKLSESFIEKFQDKVHWCNLSHYQKLSEPFIEKFQDKVHWDFISCYQNLSEAFIEKFQDKVYWYFISKHQKLSEAFIEKFQDKVDWCNICQFQKLSEPFIEKFQDKVCWDFISSNQKLSEAFIEKFQDNFDWIYISQYQKLSKKLIKKHKLNVEDNWNYVTTDFKKNYIKEKSSYWILTDKGGDYIVAFKGIRSDRYSKYNFQYQYLKGQTYTCHCDCTTEENSFGLSAWTYRSARDYCNELVIRVKIYIKDIGRIVHRKKIRCFKFKVLD